MADTEQKVLNRWMVVVGAILIQLCLGAIYAWSAFTKGGLSEAPYNFTSVQMGWIFSVGLATFAVVMAFIAGPWQAKSGPKIVAITGGLVLGLGYILGGIIGKTFIAQLICIGLIGGAGIGLAYVVPIAVGVKWFPDKKGMIMGLAVAGFGFGATIWIQLAKTWFGGLLNAPILNLPGVQSVFLIYGITFAVIVLIGSIWMKNPPAGWLPKGYTPPEPKADSKDAKGVVEFTKEEMWKTPQFYLLWLTFIFSAGTGLMIIKIISEFGGDTLRLTAFANAEDPTIAAVAAASTAMAWLAIWNGFGRIAWGIISDKTGTKIAIFLMCLAQAIAMFLFYKIGGSSAIGLTIMACIVGFNFGGNFALFPVATANFFGNKSVGVNYGWMFTAYGIGGIVMPLVASSFKDAAKEAADPTVWLTPLIIGGVVCIVAAIISILAKPPQKKITGETASE